VNALAIEVLASVVVVAVCCPSLVPLSLFDLVDDPLSATNLLLVALTTVEDLVELAFIDIFTPAFLDLLLE
jgi:hypothetical protein